MSNLNVGKIIASIGLKLGAYTSTNRPVGEEGLIIYNSETNNLEIYIEGEWLNPGQTSGSTNPNDYPLVPGQYQYFSTEWTANPANLSISDSSTTFTVPSSVKKYIRVIMWGGGSGGSSNPGKGAFVDALIPVTAGQRFKCIVGGGGATSGSSGRGGHGVGGGCGVDSNDSGAGGGGTGFFFAEPTVIGDASMFPNGVLIAGGGGGGGGGAQNAGAGTQTPDSIGGFLGISRTGGPQPGNGGQPGQPGGVGGKMFYGPSYNYPNAPRGTGGSGGPDGYSGTTYGAGGGGGAGAGGLGGVANGDYTPGEPATGDGGRGYGYGGYNSSGAGAGGNYPMKGGNGFRFNGVNLGGGGGGSHGSCHCGGGWGGGGGSWYAGSGGSGGSGAWGYEPTVIPTISGWIPSANVSINGGTAEGLGVPTSVGNSGGNTGGILILW
jgi:hypothetical protein